MTTLAVTPSVEVGLTTPAAVTPAAATPFTAASGDKIPLVGSMTIVRIINAAVSSMTVTVDSVKPSNYQTDVNPVITIPASSFGMFHIPASAYPRYADSSNLAALSYSSTTTVTGEVYNIP